MTRENAKVENRCYNCHSVGHTSTQCNLPTQVLCYNCNTLGHKAWECKESLRCRLCRDIGHKEKECPTRVDLDFQAEGMPPLGLDACPKTVACECPKILPEQPKRTREPGDTREPSTASSETEWDNLLSVAASVRWGDHCQTFDPPDHAAQTTWANESTWDDDDWSCSVYDLGSQSFGTGDLKHRRSRSTMPTLHSRLANPFDTIRLCRASSRQSTGDTSMIRFRRHSRMTGASSVCEEEIVCEENWLVIAPGVPRGQCELSTAIGDECRNSLIYKYKSIPLVKGIPLWITNPIVMHNDPETFRYI